MKDVLLEIGAGLMNWRLWWTLSWFDLKSRYRRSVIGPFWLTLSMGLTVMMLGTVYSYILGTPHTAYIPHLSLGFIVWTMMSMMIVDGCRAFMEAAPIIKQRPVPVIVFAMRVVNRNLLFTAHNFLVFVPVVFYYKIVPTWVTPLALVGLFLITINGIWIVISIGIVCARYRDIPQLVLSLVQMAFFLTPVIWGVQEIGNEIPLFLQLNLFYHFMELVRAPLLGMEPRMLSWYVAIATTVIGWIFTVLLYRVARRRLVFWI
ncbi:MAG: ABC transporter permease [Alphaproteobacteria bacterium]|uniref:ABC transporter permease n=1 Tax=Pacificispira sp. TaxID=2888761 RepID=UPI001B241B9F|nr:ABC transporter permease [Alphaproteobacteria bacterium]MEC9266161.1 ABC transporter permease [Pseudomonadota bacterium]